MAVKISVTPIIPKDFDPEAFVDEIARAQRQKTKPALIGLFRQTVEGWSVDTRPSFQGVQTITRKEIAMTVYETGGKKAEGTDMSVYSLVSKGAKSHPIAAVHAPTLRFQTGYNPATSVGRLRSGRASRFGPVITPRSVIHPGHEAREFAQLVADEHYPDFVKDMQDAANRSARRI